MKVKLLKIRTWRSDEQNYYNDYEDVINHIVTDFSDLEEIDYKEKSKLDEWVREYNYDRKDGTYYLIYEESVKTSVKAVIKEIVAKEEKAKEAIRIREEKERAEREKTIVQRKKEEEAKKLIAKKKKLEKLKKELGES